MDDLMFKRISSNIGAESIGSGIKKLTQSSSANGVPAFDSVLKKKLEETEISFSKHALARAEERGLDVSNEKIARLKDGLRIAEEKGLKDPLILVENEAYIVNVKNARVITAIKSSDLKGRAVTNIDGTVII